MADEFDGCECVWSHEYAMQRLLQFIRQNQEECTDTDCIDAPGTLPALRGRNPSGSEDSNFVMMTMLMLFAVVMYFVRPESIIKLTKSKKSIARPGHDSQDPPQPPPPAPPAIH